MVVRVLHVVGKMDRGGMETLIMNYYRNIDKKKIQFDFPVHYEERGAYDDEIEMLGGKIFRMPKTTVKNYMRYKKALNDFFMNHPEYTIIHGHLESTAFMYQSIAKKYGDKHTILHAHNTSVDKNVKGLIKFITTKIGNKRVDSYFACSNAAAKFYFGEKQISSKGLTLLPNAIDVDDFVFNMHIRKKLRIELDLNDKFVIGHIGRFFAVKNHSFLIDIFEYIVNIEPNAVLLLIGGGPLEKEIMQKVQKLNLTQAVKFLGIRSDINELLQAMDVFVLPSHSEGLPVVAVEAQASGIKCILSDNVPRETKITSEVEFVSLNNSIQEWADKILKWSDGYQRENFLEVFMSKNYSVKKSVKVLEEYYLEQYRALSV